MQVLNHKFWVKNPITKIYFEEFQSNRNTVPKSHFNRMISRSTVVHHNEPHISYLFLIYMCNQHPETLLHLLHTKCTKVKTIPCAAII